MFDGALIGSNVDSCGYDSRIAATCSHVLQGKWLQVAAGSKWLQVAVFLKIKKTPPVCSMVTTFNYTDLKIYKQVF